MSHLRQFLSRGCGGATSTTHRRSGAQSNPHRRPRARQPRPRPTPLAAEQPPRRHRTRRLHQPAPRLQEQGSHLIAARACPRQPWRRLQPQASHQHFPVKRRRALRGRNPPRNSRNPEANRSTVAPDNRSVSDHRVGHTLRRKNTKNRPSTTYKQEPPTSGACRGHASENPPQNTSQSQQAPELFHSPTTTTMWKNHSKHPQILRRQIGHQLRHQFGRQQPARAHRS